MTVKLIWQEKLADNSWLHSIVACDWTIRSRYANDMVRYTSNSRIWLDNIREKRRVNQLNKSCDDFARTAVLHYEFV
jgi:hypothetical protein